MSGIVGKCREKSGNVGKPDFQNVVYCPFVALYDGYRCIEGFLLPSAGIIWPGSLSNELDFDFIYLQNRSTEQNFK